MKSTNKTQHIAICALFTSLAIVFGYIEYLIPFNFGIPGVKLGLANLITVTVLYTLGKTEAMTISLLRVLCTALLFGNIYSFAYSIVGAILSALIMMSVKKLSFFSAIGVSVCGGVLHNLGQLLVAVFVIDSLNVLFYLPVLLVSGALTGAIIGICSLPVIKKLNIIKIRGR